MSYAQTTSATMDRAFSPYEYSHMQNPSPLG
jgi:hypothetical protein